MKPVEGDDAFAAGIRGREGVNATAHIHIETLRLAKQDFVDGKKAAIAVAVSRELGGNLLGGAVDEGLGQVLGRRCGYGSGLGEVADAILLPTQKLTSKPKCRNAFAL